MACAQMVLSEIMLSRRRSFSRSSITSKSRGSPVASWNFKGQAPEVSFKMVTFSTFQERYGVGGGAARLESCIGNSGGLRVAKAKRGVGRGHSSGEAGQCPWVSINVKRSRGAKGSETDETSPTRRVVCGKTARCAFAMLRRHRPVR